MTEEPIHSSDRQPEDPDAALRPKSLTEFIGQEAARDNLRVFIEAARGRGEAMDHVLFFGPPGLGKTTLARIVASEMGADLHVSAGPVLERPGDLAATLTNLEGLGRIRVLALAKDAPLDGLRCLRSIAEAYGQASPRVRE